MADTVACSPPLRGSQGTASTQPKGRAQLPGQDSDLKLQDRDGLEMRLDALDKEAYLLGYVLEVLRLGWPREVS